MRSHMQEHPRESSFACHRKTLLGEIDPRSIEATRIIELPKRADVDIIIFDDLNSLENTENVKNIL